MFRQYDLEGLLKIFEITVKKDLVKHCKTLTIHESDLAKAILVAEAGVLGYFHQIHYRDYVSDHLQPRKREIRALADNGSGELKGDALKLVRKLYQLSSERRHIVGHMFFNHDRTKWHFFYFDQRDTSTSKNHWKLGSHLHLINYLWPNRSTESVWSEFTSGNPNMKDSLHVRFVNDHKKEHSRIHL